MSLPLPSMSKNSHIPPYFIPYFSIEEDKLFISSWINVSLDSIVGDDKKLEAFWKRIVENYTTHRDNLIERSNNQLKS